MARDLGGDREHRPDGGPELVRRSPQQVERESRRRVEAVFDVARSRSLTDAQKARVTARLGPRVTASAQDTRSQSRNRELALERLAERLAHALEVRRPRTATRPTQAGKRRRLDAKKRRGELKRGRRWRPDA